MIIGEAELRAIIAAQEARIVALESALADAVDATDALEVRVVALETVGT